MLLQGAIAYTVWGFFLQQYYLQVADPIIYRIVVSAVISFFLIGSYVFKNDTAWLRAGFYISAYVMVAHTAVILIWAQFHWIHFAGFIILISGVMQLIDSRIQSFIFTGVVLGYTLIAVAFIDHTSIPIPFIMLLLGSGIFPALSSNLNRIKIHEHLKISGNERLDMLENMLEGVMFTSGNGQIIFANKAAEKILSQEPGELSKKSLKDIVKNAYREDGSDFAFDDRPIAKALATGKPQKNVVMGFSREPGQIGWIRLTAVPLFAEGSSVATSCIATFLDISEIRHAEKSANESRERMVSSSRLAALGEMAGGVAHEINTPLGSILARLGIIEMKLQEDGIIDAYAENLSKLEATVMRIKKIVQGLRSFARDGALDDFVDVKVSDVIDETLDLCNEKLKLQNIELRKNIQPDLLIHAQVTQISQVLLNLIQNAHDAIEKDKVKWIELCAKETEEFIEISVTDSGLGIPEQIRNKILEPFFTTKAVGKGTGLGLSISARLIKSHQGQLFVDASSKNTKFVIQLPKHSLARNTSPDGKAS